jgi:phage tail-like protein
MAVESNGHFPSSSLLAYLPQPYQDDPFLERFLSIPESIFRQIEGILDALPYYFDPRTAPEAFLPWLAGWVGQELDENWPIAKRRALVAGAVSLYRRRGTRSSMREHLRLYTGRAPLIVENFDGMRLGQDAALGLNTRLGRPQPNCIAITVLAGPDEPLDERILRRIIANEKPAWAGYTLEVRMIEAEPPDGVGTMPAGDGEGGNERGAD